MFNGLTGLTGIGVTPPPIPFLLWQFNARPAYTNSGKPVLTLDTGQVPCTGWAECFLPFRSVADGVVEVNGSGRAAAEVGATCAWIPGEELIRDGVEAVPTGEVDWAAEVRATGGREAEHLYFESVRAALQLNPVTVKVVHLGCTDAELESGEPA